MKKSWIDPRSQNILFSFLPNRFRTHFLGLSVHFSKICLLQKRVGSESKRLMSQVTPRLVMREEDIKVKCTKISGEMGVRCRPVQYAFSGESCPGGKTDTKGSGVKNLISNIPYPNIKIKKIEKSLLRSMNSTFWCMIIYHI